MSTIYNADQSKVELAVQMVLLDAIEKRGNVGPEALTAYMQSATFEQAVKSYLALMQ